jgi:uncharacterized membrane protein YjfL (UPF0719 family)
MNKQLFTLSIIEITLSIIISIIIILITYKMLKWLFFRDHDLRGDNLAFTIFTSGIILSIGIVLSEILPSITNIIRLSTTQTETIDVFNIVKYSGIYLLIGFLISVILNASVFLLFSVLTPGVHEFKEIKNNNVSVAILVIAILISITIITKNSIALLISSLIPYPEVTNFL